MAWSETAKGGRGESEKTSPLSAVRCVSSDKPSVVAAVLSTGAESKPSGNERSSGTAADWSPDSCKRACCSYCCFLRVVLLVAAGRAALAGGGGVVIPPLSSSSGAGAANAEDSLEMRSGEELVGNNAFESCLSFPLIIDSRRLPELGLAGEVGLAAVMGAAFWIFNAPNNPVMSIHIQMSAN